MRVGADVRFDLVGDLGVGFQIFLDLVLTLNALAVHGEPRARLVDELKLHAKIDDLADLGDAFAVDDVKFGLLERGRDLVFDDLGAGTVAHHFRAGFERFDAAHVDADAREVFERAAARRRFGVAVHNADLLAQLVDEDDDGIRLGDGARELAQRLRHQPRHHADAALAHLSFKLAAREESGHGVHHDDIHRAGAHKRFGNIESLLAGVRLGDEKVIDIHAERAGVSRFKRVLHIDVCGLAAALLGAGDDMQRERRLAAGFGAVNLNDAAARYAADAEREIQRKRAGGDRLNVHGNVVAETHDRALAVVLFNLSERGFERFFLVGRRSGGRSGGLFLFCHDASLTFLQNR